MHRTQVHTNTSHTHTHAHHTHSTHNTSHTVHITHQISHTRIHTITHTSRTHHTRIAQIAFNDLAYYENHTDTNGYFTGDSAYSVAWLALGELERAEAEFNNSFAHMQAPFNVWKERISGGHQNFITGPWGRRGGGRWTWVDLHAPSVEKAFILVAGNTSECERASPVTW